MKLRSTRFISILLLLCIIIGSFASCDIFGDNGGTGDGTTDTPKHEHVDYVSQIKLDMSSDTLKQEVTVKFYIDGDTTHFYAPKSIDSTGVVKARYLAVDTPESTGKIEEWGKTAAKFTEEKLRSATSIIIESDDNKWNQDGNGRYLVWVWYKTAESEDYINLNIELLQAGLARGHSSSETRYGEAAVKCVSQATTEKLYVFSGEKDPTYPYGKAESVTIKELRLNTADYAGKKVAIEGVVTYNCNWTAFVESYDPETEMYYGIQVFYGYTSALTNVLAQGNKVRIVGVVQLHSGSYQISGLTYNAMKPDLPDNTATISKNNPIEFNTITSTDFYGEKTITVGEDAVEKTFDFYDLALSTAVEMKNLKVVDVYTTESKTDSNGAMTLTCKSPEGHTMSVRTEVLFDDNGNLITESYFINKTIDVKGIIEYFDLNNTGDGTYQIKVYTLSDVTRH